LRADNVLLFPIQVDESLDRGSGDKTRLYGSLKGLPGGSVATHNVALVLVNVPESPESGSHCLPDRSQSIFLQLLDGTQASGSLCLESGRLCRGFASLILLKFLCLGASWLLCLDDDHCLACPFCGGRPLALGYRRVLTLTGTSDFLGTTLGFQELCRGFDGLRECFPFRFTNFGPPWRGRW
jgi:hypothetical protein